MRCSFLLVLLVCTAAACSRYPTAPSAAFDAAAMDVTSPLANESPLALRSVTGRTTNVLTGAAIGGVTVRIADVGSAVADATGGFTMESEALDGRYRITASGAAVIERQTSVAFPGDTARVSLIPATFSLAALDQMVRSFGEVGVLKRWTQAPALIVETSMLNRDASFDASGTPLDAVVASAEPMTEAAINELVGQLTRALPLMSGGQLTAFSGISRQTTAAGETVPFDTGSNAVVVARYPGTGVCRGFASIAYTEEYAVVAARVLVQTCTGTLAAPVVAHELGHALGYGHVTSAASVMTATVTGDVTEFDRQAATIAYLRPPGNRTPDVDPEAFTVNQPAPARRGAGRIIAGPIE